MYQHDVSEQKLAKTLDAIVTECVSFVGEFSHIFSYVIWVIGLKSFEQNSVGNGSSKGIRDTIAARTKCQQDIKA